MKKVVGIMLSLIMAVTLFGAVSTFAGEADTYRELKIGSIDSKAIGHFDTTMALDGNYNGYAMDLVFDYILFVDPETDEYTSNILSDFYWDEEQTAVVFTLKDGVYFSNGDQMTADDILYTVERLTTSFMNAEMLGYLKMDEITISDDQLTITIPFSQNYGAWMALFGGNSSVHNRSWEEEHGGAGMNFDDPALACGSGPYKVTEYVVDAYTVFEKRDDWWMEGQQSEGTASFDKIIVSKYNDATTMMVDYETGSIDVAFGLTAADYDRIAADPSLGQAGMMNTHFVATLALNVDASALSDKHLREVFAYGVDWKQVAQLAFGSLGKEAHSTLPADNWAFVDGLTYEYNPEKAQQIVDENNLSGAELTFLTIPGVNATIAEVSQGMLQQYGIDMKVDIRDMATATVMWMNPSATCALIDAAAFSNLSNDPFLEYRNLFAGAMFKAAAKQDPVINDILNRGRFSIPQEERKAAYEEAQQYIYDEIYLIPICEWYSAYCYNDAVISYMNPYDLSMPSLRDIIPAE